jgi:mRNA-degrading endonuclease toxin of MazEF toxin-antitoxin module
VNRGDVVVAALPGDAGKPRPWIVLRADRFPDHSRVMLLPLTDTDEVVADLLAAMSALQVRAMAVCARMVEERDAAGT